MASTWRALLLLVVATLSLCAVSGDGAEEEVQALVINDGCQEANPQIPYLGYGAITFSPNPPVVNEETTVHVRVRNNGGVPAEGVEVTLSWAEFGLGFEEGEEIGSQTTDIGEGDEVVLSFTHIFRSRARHSFVAHVKSVRTGGNCRTDDDTGVVNLDFLHVEVDENDAATFDIPVRNSFGSEPLAVTGLEVFCFSYRALTDEDLPLPIEWGGTGGAAHTPIRPTGTPHFIDDWQGETAYMRLPNGAFFDIWQGQNGVGSFAIDWEVCPFEAKMFTAEGEEIPTSGELTVLPGEQTVVQVLATGFSEVAAEKGATFVGVWADVGGTSTHAATMLKPASVEDLLNSKLLCCLKSVRDRVRFGRSLLLALEAYKAGDVAGAIGMLRFLLEEVELKLCDLTGPESGCLERLALMLQQIARLMASEGQLLTATDPDAIPVVIQEEGDLPPPKRRSLLEFQIPEKVVMEKDGDFYGRIGLPGAALIKYQRAQLRYGGGRGMITVNNPQGYQRTRQTTTCTRLSLPKEVVDQYVRLFVSSDSFGDAASFRTSGVCSASDSFDSDKCVLTVHVCHL